MIYAAYVWSSIVNSLTLLTIGKESKIKIINTEMNSFTKLFGI